MLALKLQSILAARGKSADFMRDAHLQDDSDGKGPYLKHWDEARLGPRPTQAEIDAAVPFVPAAAHRSRERLEKVLGMTLAEIKAELGL